MSVRSSRVSAIVLTSILVVVGLAPTQVSAAPPSPPGDCASTLAASHVAAGDLGTGWTVSKGRDPEPFSIEVLGVVADGIAPGRDLIVVDTASEAIERAGGIWFGMSGSPVYVEREGQQRLIGALAYGFSFGPTTLAGLTPASDLLGVAHRPAGAVSTAAAEQPAVANLDVATRRSVAAELGVPLSHVERQMERLTVPLALRTHPARAGHLTQQLRERSQRTGLRVLPYTVGASGNNSHTEGVLAPGGNFAGALSYGDLTLAGIGTTSYVCDGRAVAFGHPFLFTGPTAMGANAADALAIVADQVFGPYKFATVAETVGTVDQDRLGGIRALLGVTPPSVPITSTVTVSDEGDRRDGRTEVVFTDFLEDLALFHTLFNIDAVFDRVGGGSSEVTATVTGTRAGGVPWTVSIGNRFASSWDIAWVSVFDLYFGLLQLHRNDFEPVDISDVHIDVDVEGTSRTYELRRVLVSNNGVDYVPLAQATLQAGRTEHLRAVLRATERRNGKLVSTPTDAEVDVTLDVPRDLHGMHLIEVAAGSPGGEDPFECLFDPEACGGDPALSFDDVLAAVATRARNDDLTARLLPLDHGGDGDEGPIFEDDDEPRVEPVAETTAQLDRAASGRVEAPIYVEPLPTSKPAFVRGNRWRLRILLDGGPADVSLRFGKSTDVKLLCDWTGNGSTPVVFRDGTWYAKASLDGGEADRVFRFGRTGDTPVCGDWNGNGKESPGVVRGRTWMLRNTMTRGAPAHEFTWGLASDLKVVGDWNGDGRDTPGLRRGTQWRLRNKLTSGSPTIVFDFGSRRGQPVVGDWNANNKDGVGVVVDGRWRLRNSLKAGGAQVAFDYGQAGDQFLTWKP